MKRRTGVELHFDGIILRTAGAMGYNGPCPVDERGLFPRTTRDLHDILRRAKLSLLNTLSYSAGSRQMMDPDE